MSSIFKNIKNSNTDTETHSDSELCDLSEKETKQYLTPFAFKLDKSLFGLPLASPLKRGTAILIDLALIALISDVSGVFLAFAIAVTLYYLGKNNSALTSDKKIGQKRRAIMRFIAAFILFIVLLDTLPPLLKFVNRDENAIQVQLDDKSLSLTESIAFGAITLTSMQAIDDSDCKTFNCWKTQLNLVAINMANISYEGDINITPTQLDDMVKNIVQEIDLTKNEQAKIISSMHDSYAKTLTELTVGHQSIESDKSIATIVGSNKGENLPDIHTTIDTSKDSKPKQPVYSIIEWAKGIVNDLGLGLGWATFYFTAFTALWQGQTMGKKLLGIKVLQLDGTPLSLWDSFGRYGGYGAGLATGLIGFIQIYWDPNKQAIHDKISSTVVIDIKAARLTIK